MNKRNLLRTIATLTLASLLLLNLNGCVLSMILEQKKNVEKTAEKITSTAEKNQQIIEDAHQSVQDAIQENFGETDQPTTEQEEEQQEAPAEQVAGTQKQYFLTDFENYAPQSTANIIGYKEAKEIAQIGFEESARRIAGEGTENEASEKMEYNFAFANNYFTRQGMERDKTYDTIQRPCYIFTRTNDMGCGVRIYVDAVTGLIIGGDAFGD